MKNLKITLITLVVACLTSCSVTLPLHLTNNTIGSKVGKSTTGSIFNASGGAIAPVNGYAPMYHGLMFNKDFSIADAAKKGGISKIATVDIRVDWYVFFTKKTYIVTGE
jgi:hypothetical protein